MQAATMSLQLLGCFRLSVASRTTHLPLQAQRLIAYLAVSEAPIPRKPLAERLWPFTSQARAQANLRTALWKVRQEAPQSVTVGQEAVELDSGVSVDYRDLVRTPIWEDLASMLSEMRVVAQLRSDLLPGWDEEWLMIARERSRQLRMRCLEDLSRFYLGSGNTLAAIEAAFASIEIEPLRESAHLALIEAHVADGNMAEAVHQAARLQDLVRNELGVAPSARFQNRLMDLGVALSS
jgi:DNA-binding SARP family transcriptional activator